VELTIDFDEDEVQLTSDLFARYADLAETSSGKLVRGEYQPSRNRHLQIIYYNGKAHFRGVPASGGLSNQFLGRYFLRLIEKISTQDSTLINRIGDVFWFDQYRNLGTVFGKRSTRGNSSSRSMEGWRAGVEQLRESLVGWWAYYASELDNPNKNAIKDLERRFAALFPGTHFRGTMPRNGVIGPGVKDFYFLLERAGRQYDLAEMASGEQAVFSLLYDFVRLKIAKSIVLIDELELHLHPPAQQALYAALPKIGEDCQFFITTHSEYLTSVIPDEYKVRLEGGRPCL
jgi:hypothetical protein